ncbi:Nif3-like dinuclear metal center hexameric protein [candidate division KSB1 bacterium]|nr:Nif3-like dinuclear metal center hexameric protein [candidate division KSB1 bacterium]
MVKTPNTTTMDHITEFLTANDIHRYLISLGSAWIDLENTVDTFKAGDPATVVTGIAVGWMSYFRALEETVESGCNVFITHEPTFYDHHDNDPSVFDFDIAHRKKDFIRRNNLVIIRCHDVWDRMPEIGITDSWAQFLGLSKKNETQRVLPGSCDPRDCRRRTCKAHIPSFYNCS